MLCPQCKQERKEDDFMGKEICYKCEYTRKILLLKKKKPEKRNCLICGNFLPSFKWKYCSYTCANKGKADLDKKYWITGAKCLNKIKNPFRLTKSRNITPFYDEESSH